MIYYCVYKSPVGDIFLASGERGLIRASIGDAAGFFAAILRIGVCRENGQKNLWCMNQLDDYFNGELEEFDLPLDLTGTDFQRRVWRELMRIPYGQTRTYGEIAKTVRSCPRAVGQANRKNPVSIIVPCHRVVASSGIGGYGGRTAGRNIEIKRSLLLLEGVRL